MKRIAAIAGLLLIFALALGAAVWDGSAVAGGAGDFPDDGFYGACNSFPRDTSVTVTNLENGKSVTVTITRNVDNPGIFIALSPKAAAELGMRVGTATRIRAVALVASQAESSLPPARAGETADPDYNPRVYVEREKAAVAAATAGQSAAAAAPTAPSVAAVAAPAVAPAAPAPATSAAPSAPERAEVMAKTAEPIKRPMPAVPSLSEPKASAVAPVAAAPAASVPAPSATAPAVAAAIVPAPASSPPTSKPEASATFPSSPKKSAVGAILPSPPLPATAATTAGVNPAQAPEVVGGETKPSPRKPTAPRLVFIEPSLPSQSSSGASTAVAAPEKASVDALKRPSAGTTPYGFALAEPVPGFGPDELPEALLSRITAPTKVVPNPVLAEAEAPKNLGDLRTKPEAISLDRPSYAEAVQAALAEALVVTPAATYAVDRPGKVRGEEGVAELPDAAVPGAPEAVFATKPGKSASSEANADLAEAEIPGSPESIADRKVPSESGPLSELQVPDVPRPVEGIAGLRPKGVAAGAMADLGEPAVPVPTESLTAGKAKSVKPGAAVAELAEPDSTGKGTSVIAGEKPSKAATPESGELASPSVPNPTESIAAEHPAAVSGGAKAVTLEPAMPRPPASAVATAAPAAPTLVPTEPKQPATVATVTSPGPAGALHAPASVPILSGLAKGSYYVQIGVYGTNEALTTAVAGFKSTHYPLAVEKLTTKKGSAAFRLFVGPLSRDESGLVLIRIRSLGYKDAYIRQGT